MQLTLANLRKELKQAGFSLKVSTYSDFKAGYITHIETGKTLHGIMTKADYDILKPAIDIRDKYKGQLYDGLYRVVL